MRKILSAILVIASSPGIVLGQTGDACPECVIGLWQRPFSQNFGFTTQFNPITIGVGYWSSAGSAVQEVEFSISNLSDFIVSFEPTPGATLVMGTPPAPSDTTGTEAGGMRIAWDTCLPAGDVTVMTLTITPLLPNTDDHVLWVLRKFPPSVPGALAPLFTKCGAAAPTTATGGCFVLNPIEPNPDQIVDGCFYYAGLAVEQQPWSSVKMLYRD